MIAKTPLSAALAVLLLAGTAVAQATSTDSGPGVAAPGPAGTERPSDGAIKGGSILPGENAGAPTGRGATTPETGQSRCAELTGVLREQCLADARDASRGAAREPGPDTTSGNRDRGPRTEPPPQTPR